MCVRERQNRPLGGVSTSSLEAVPRPPLHRPLAFHYHQLGDAEPESELLGREKPFVADLIRAPQPTLFVDLDGTLIASNLLLEAIVPLIARQSRLLWRLPGWPWQGRDVLKANLANQVV
ncbi:MAG: hypothetical protein ACKV0T_17445 [Planctomycetales bacterium]